MKDCDLAFICNPNNPTGQLIRKSDMVQIVDAARKSGCCLVVDEAFIDFIPGESIIKNVVNKPISDSHQIPDQIFRPFGIEDWIRSYQFRADGYDIQT